MIAHPLKALFVHIPKTAGQTIEHVFLSHLGLDQNARPALLLREKLEHESGPPRLSHLKASDYHQYGYLSEQQYDDYYKFCFVRNPWSRVLSFYRYLRFEEQYNFDDFVCNVLEQQMQNEPYHWFLAPQSDFIYDQHKQLLINFVGRYERLQADFDHISTQLGLLRTELPVINTSLKFRHANNGGTKSDYRQLYTTQSIDHVAKLYQRDIDLLGYDFE